MPSRDSRQCLKLHWKGEEDHLKSTPPPRPPILKLMDEANSRLKNTVVGIIEDEGGNTDGFGYAEMELLLPASFGSFDDAQDLVVGFAYSMAVPNALEKIFSREESLMDPSAHNQGDIETSRPEVREEPGGRYGIVIGFTVIGLIDSTDEARKFLDDVENKLDNKRDLISRKLFEELVDMGLLPSNPRRPRRT